MNAKRRETGQNVKKFDDIFVTQKFSSVATTKPGILNFVLN